MSAVEVVKRGELPAGGAHEPRGYGRIPAGVDQKIQRQDIRFIFKLSGKIAAGAV